MLRWTLGYMCLFQFWFPRCVCPAVGLMGHKAVLFPVFKGISTLFSIVAVLVCIPTNSARGFPFLHTLSSIYCFWIAAILTGVKWYLIVILICISLIMIILTFEILTFHLLWLKLKKKSKTEKLDHSILMCMHDTKSL